MEKYPLVSVIIPTYSRPDNICRAIDSVLRQTYPNIEIIVVDDNGEGTECQIMTEKQLKQYIDKNLIIYIKHFVNKNGSAARNTGYRVCKGEYVNFLDDDDILLPNKISKQVEILQRYTEYGATYCNSIIKRVQNLTNRLLVVNTVYRESGDLCKEYLLDKVKFNTSTILFKRSVIDELNGFDESFKRHQDYEFMVRFFRNEKIICTGVEALSEYDTTMRRTFISNGERELAIKEKFLNTFENDFIKRGIRDEIFHFFWYVGAFTALQSQNYKYFQLMYTKSAQYGRCSIWEYSRLLKCFFVGLLKNRK